MAAITITNAGLNLLRDGMRGAATPQITYVAIGTSTTTPAATDTQLGAEAFRKAVTSAVAGGSNGEVIITLYLAPGDANGINVQEVGFFGGAATGTANSGTLLAHGLWAHGVHNNTESINFSLDFTV